MPIRLVCYDCRKILKVSGFPAVNEVGRKYCDRCGSNYDNLHVIGTDEYNKAIIAQQKDERKNNE